MRLTDFDTLTFDCYGTLIDWELGMLEALRPLAARAGRTIGDEDILAAHARHESAQQAQTPAKPYRDLLAVVHRRLAEEWGVPATWPECVAYGRSVGNWPAFPDTADALARLQRHFKLVILSNVDNDSFSRSREKLGVEFDGTYTAEDIGSYKPDPANFEYMLAHLRQRGVERSRILHTAESLFHDHRPANQLGLASCWIHRRHDRKGFGATMDPQSMPHFDFRFRTMGEMADACEAELRG